jgi:ATP/maltotriose-dependent transcriptional regulator MalT
VPFEGRREELDELERLLGEERQAVVIEAHGGFGKTRLAVELARSGRSATPWFFIPYGMPFKADYLA